MDRIDTNIRYNRKKNGLTIGDRISYILRRRVMPNWQLYLVIMLPIIYIIIFKYFPMYGAQIAFKDYSVTKGFFGSSWVGGKHFMKFFNSNQFWRLIDNTLSLSLYGLIAGFPFPIILALALNEIGNKSFKKVVQMVTYAPYFISMVILVSIVMQVLSPRVGILNIVIQALGGEQVNFMGEPEMFRHIFVWSGIWQMTGYSAVIYIAALSGIDPQLYEAAIVDGATRVQRIWHISLPGIMPTTIILLILNVGQIMNVGFEKVYLMQNPLNLRTSEVIATYVYKVGLIQSNFSFSTAVGLFNSLINLILLVIVNAIAKRVSETSLW